MNGQREPLKLHWLPDMNFRELFRQLVPGYPITKKEIGYLAKDILPAETAGIVGQGNDTCAIRLSESESIETVLLQNILLYRNEMCGLSIQIFHQILLPVLTRLVMQHILLFLSKWSQKMCSLQEQARLELWQSQFAIL